MKTVSFTFLFFNIYFVLSVDDDEAHGCLHKTRKDGDTIINSFTENSGKNSRADCFSYSYYPNEEEGGVFQDLCCYNNATHKCTTFTEGKGVICPTASSADSIQNRCGNSGVYEPHEDSDCTGVSLVEAYCCYVETEVDGVKHTACLRSKDMKDKDDWTDDINDQLKKFPNHKKQRIKCAGGFIKNALYSAVVLIAFALF